MLIWDIKHDGWRIGSLKGKKKAVDMLKKRLEWEEVTNQIWDNKNGIIFVHTDKGVFVIEENHD